MLHCKFGHFRVEPSTDLTAETPQAINNVANIGGGWDGRESIECPCKTIYLDVNVHEVEEDGEVDRRLVRILRQS